MKTNSIFKRLIILLFITVNFISLSTFSYGQRKLYREFKNGYYPAVITIANTMIEDDKNKFVAHYYLGKVYSAKDYPGRDIEIANFNIMLVLHYDSTLNDKIKKECFKKGRFNTDSIVCLHKRINYEGFMIAKRSDSTSCLWKPYDYYLKNYDNKYTSDLSLKADSLRYIRYTKPNTKKVRREFDEKFHDSRFCKVNRIEYNQLFITEIDTCDSDQTNKVYYEIKSDSLIYDSTLTYCITQYNSKLSYDFEKLTSIINRFKFFKRLDIEIIRTETKINLNNLAIEVTTKKFSTLKNSVSQRVYIDSLLSFPFIDIEDGTWWNDIIDTYNKTLLNTPPDEITNFLNTHEVDTLITRETRTQLIVILNKAYSDSINKTFEIEIILSLFESWSDNPYKNKILFTNEWNNFVEGRLKNILISKTSEEIEELLAKHSLDSLITDEIENIYANKIFDEFRSKKGRDEKNKFISLKDNENNTLLHVLYKHQTLLKLKKQLNEIYYHDASLKLSNRIKMREIILEWHDWLKNSFKNNDSLINLSIIEYHNKRVKEILSKKPELIPEYLIDLRNDPLTEITDTAYLNTVDKFIYIIKDDNSIKISEFRSILGSIKNIIKTNELNQLKVILGIKREHEWNRLINETNTEYPFCKNILEEWINDSEFPLSSDFKNNAIKKFCIYRFNQVTAPDTYKSYVLYLNVIKKENNSTFQNDSLKAITEDSIYSKLTACHCIKGNEEFLKKHRADIPRYVIPAENNIYSLSTEGTTLYEYEAFYKKYPHNHNHKDALKQILRKYLENSRLSDFILKYPEIYDKKNEELLRDELQNDNYRKSLLNNKNIDNNSDSNTLKQNQEVDHGIDKKISLPEPSVKDTLIDDNGKENSEQIHDSSPNKQ